MMGGVMKQQGTGWRGLWLAAALLAGGLAGASPAGAADIEEDPAAAYRLSREASRVCTDGCMGRCRTDRTDCKDGKTGEDTENCPAQFQICARRCVVSCSPK
jgi:hypothetical protein